MGAVFGSFLVLPWTFMGVFSSPSNRVEPSKLPFRVKYIVFVVAVVVAVVAVVAVAAAVVVLILLLPLFYFCFFCFFLSRTQSDCCYFCCFCGCCCCSCGCGCGCGWSVCDLVCVRRCLCSLAASGSQSRFASPIIHGSSYSAIRSPSSVVWRLTFWQEIIPVLSSSESRNASVISNFGHSRGSGAPFSSRTLPTPSTCCRRHPHSTSSADLLLRRYF